MSSLNYRYLNNYGFVFRGENERTYEDQRSVGTFLKRLRAGLKEVRQCSISSEETAFNRTQIRVIFGNVSFQLTDFIHLGEARQQGWISEDDECIKELKELQRFENRFLELTMRGTRTTSGATLLTHFKQAVKDEVLSYFRELCEYFKVGLALDYVASASYCPFGDEEDSEDEESEEELDSDDEATILSDSEDEDDDIMPAFDELIRRFGGNPDN